jgi:2-methylcitrate dehydratase PrpD
VSPEGELARFAAELDWDALPERVRRRVGDLLLDTLASALAGRTADGLDQIEALAAQLGSGETTTVIGDGRASLVAGTLRNAHQTTAVTVCDVYRPALCHVTPGVVAPALAVAEARGAAGRDLLAALAAGFEVTVRIGRGLRYAAFRERGWHSPGVIGPFGGAAAVARVLGLDASRTINALGLAGSQSAGTFSALGTETVKFHQSRGAVSGLLAGLLAETGFRASQEILTAADGGLLSAYSDGGDPSAMVAELGAEWELERISLRAWPVASALQSVVACVLELIAEGGAGADGVARMEVRLPPASYELSGTGRWDVPLAAQQSARYVAAAVLHDGRCWLEQFAPERVADPALQRFVAERTAVEADDSLPTAAAGVSVVTAAGECRTVTRQVPKGDPTDPLSQEELREKLGAAAASAGLRDRAGPIAVLVDDLAAMNDVAPLLDALRRRP